jgi:hypothetical protein
MRATLLLLMDARLWHTSGSTFTKEEDRAILFAYYSAPHMRPLDKLVSQAAKGASRDA